MSELRVSAPLRSRRGNSESLARMLGPKLLAEVDLFIYPGAEMPSCETRKGLQKKYKVDQKIIYNYLHVNGLRLSTEEKSRCRSAIASSNSEKRKSSYNKYSEKLASIFDEDQGRRASPSPTLISTQSSSKHSNRDLITSISEKVAIRRRPIPLPLRSQISTAEQLRESENRSEGEDVVSSHENKKHWSHSNKACARCQCSLPEDFQADTCAPCTGKQHSLGRASTPTDVDYDPGTNPHNSDGIGDDNFMLPRSSEKEESTGKRQRKGRPPKRPFPSTKRECIFPGCHTILSPQYDYSTCPACRARRRKEYHRNKGVSERVTKSSSRKEPDLYSDTEETPDISDSDLVDTLEAAVQSRSTSEPEERPESSVMTDVADPGGESDLKAQTTFRKCTRNGCKSLVPMDHEYKLCDACRQYFRDYSRKSAMARKKSTAETADSERKRRRLGDVPSGLTSATENYESVPQGDGDGVMTGAGSVLAPPPMSTLSVPSPSITEVSEFGGIQEMTSMNVPPRFKWKGQGQRGLPGRRI